MNIEQEIIDAAIELGVPEDEIEDAYIGYYTSPEEYAEELIDSCYDLGQMMGKLSAYFDYKKLGRDLVISDVMEHEGHYFYQQW